jgi:cellulose synthase/poly-beta-1,6-N-acetylglucosamine synthase-like glycosyltransferase
MTPLDLFLTLLAAALAVPLAVLAVECLAALLPARRSPDGPRPTVAVLVPAHDEEAGLPATLTALQSQLDPGDRLLVVADNCTDRTAAAARACRAEVLERHDAARLGKGYALAAGVDALRAGPPDVVVIVDADCRPGPGAIDQLARTAAITNRPVQAAYALDPPTAAGSRQQAAGSNTRDSSSLPAAHCLLPGTARLSAWAFRVKNVVRPRGLRRLGLPCLLTGSGMAFPWRLLRDAPLASGHIVEDMKLGIDLAVAGRSPVFEPAAAIGGELPAARGAARSQRTRWEHGHLGTLISQTPRLLREAVRQRRFDLAGLALELGVPPLSVLVMLWTVAVVVAVSLADSWLPAAVLLSGGAAAGVTGLLAWARFGRGVLPPAALLAAPVYAAGKLPIYLAFLVRRQRAWVRTPRNDPPPEPLPGEVAQ